MRAVENACAGPFGALYDFWIERERVARLVGVVAWGIETRPTFQSVRSALANLAPESTVVDVPCGGGVAFRGLRPDQRLRYLAVDLDEKMLARARRRARKLGLTQPEFIAADMRYLPVADGSVDLCLSYGGLHMIPDPHLALAEMSRCLRPGGELIGTTFLAEGSLRQRALFSLGYLMGYGAPAGSAKDLERWLEHAQLIDIEVRPRKGFVIFQARKPTAGRRATATSS